MLIKLSDVKPKKGTTIDLSKTTKKEHIIKTKISEDAYLKINNLSKYNEYLMYYIDLIHKNIDAYHLDYQKLIKMKPTKIIYTRLKIEYKNKANTIAKEVGLQNLARLTTAIFEDCIVSI
jgi:hypothetical protein